MTLTYSEIMIRYGELSTKGKNRMRFIISKMFYLSIQLSKWQPTAIGHMLIFMGRIMNQ